MSNLPPDADAENRFKRGRTRGATALKRRRRKSDLDVVRSTSFVPLSWRRKVGRAGNLLESFYHAFHGVAVGLKEQRNLRIHFSLAAVVTILGLTLRIDMMSWMALVIVMALVIACEFINTSLEHLVDISANNEYHAAARAAKDTAAAAVLSVSLAALIVGLMVFGPKLYSLFFPG
ncbi:MAG: diacylglycerol kinase family protein [Candidatus Obscuribacterales bacterium]|nr:diacylglycerol kinase family protein [Candidatus Obscuribacterales bacterium]